MGTTGAGVFDNDAAMDARDDVTNYITAAIADFLNEPGFGVEDTEAAVGYVALLTGLMESCRASGPGIAEATKWRDQVLDVFDREIDGLAPVPGFKQERRAVIVATFTRLLAAHSEGAG